MSSAKRCDICGKFYEVPPICNDFYIGEEWKNTSMIRVLRLKNSNNDRIDHDVMQFDACDECLQDVLDYMLAKRADVEKGE